MTLSKQSGFTFHDHAADPSVDGELQRNKERVRFFKGQVQSIVQSELPSVHPGLNILRNPSFEVDGADGVAPTGWTLFGVAETDNADKIDGSYSVKLPVDAVLTVRAYQNITVKTGQRIRCSVWCKTSETIRAFVRLLRAPVTTLAFAQHSGSGNWELLWFEYEATADETIQFELVRFTGGAADVWFDIAVCLVDNLPFRRPTSRIITNAMSPYPIELMDEILQFDTSGGNVIANLPTVASSHERRIDLIKTTGDTNIVTIVPNGADTINGRAGRALYRKRQRISLFGESSTPEWNAWKNAPRWKCEPIQITIPKRPAANPPGEGIQDLIPTLDFDDGTDESVILEWRMPNQYLRDGAVKI